MNDDFSLMSESVGPFSLFCVHFTKCDALPWLHRSNCHGCRLESAATADQQIPDFRTFTGETISIEVNSGRAESAFQPKMP